MVEQNDTEQLKALNQYNVKNSWFGVNFGGCPYGIFSTACPVEPLHALEMVLYHKIESIGELVKLDKLVKKLITLPRQKNILWF